MNIRSNVVFANQADKTYYDEHEFDGHKAKMITTDTRGVGINRNLALMYANADICLFSDDDVVYCDDMENKVLAEFAAHPDADVIIFHFDTDSKTRPQKKYSKTKKCGKLSRMPWATFRVAFKLEKMRKLNLWFTTLFGGGCIFPSGEDSMWLSDAKKSGLAFYVSKETIGTVSFETSTWFSAGDERFYYGKGAFYKAAHPKTDILWMLYFVFRTMKTDKMPTKDKLKWMMCGVDGYKKMMSYDDYCNYIKGKSK